MERTRGFKVWSLEAFKDNIEGVTMYFPKPSWRLAAGVLAFVGISAVEGVATYGLGLAFGHRLGTEFWRAPILTPNGLTFSDPVVQQNRQIDFPKPTPPPQNR